MQINKNEFEFLLTSVNSCYAKDFSGKLPHIEDFPSEIFHKNDVDLNLLETQIYKYSNVYLKSVALRIIAIFELRNARDLNLTLDVKKVWKHILDSILIIPINATISSIGSQGFLSIPLFKYDKEKEFFDFIRLHIWDDSLTEYINAKSCKNFSIHTHSFYAESWILCGKVINKQYKVRVVDTPTNYSLFSVGYNKSLNEVNQHTSSANNTQAFVDVNQISHESYMYGGTYTVKAGDFHSSDSEGENGLSATLFSFKAKNGLADQSYVVGPSQISSSEINRKMIIDPTELLKRIDKKIN